MLDNRRKPERRSGVSPLEDTRRDAAAKQLAGDDPVDIIPIDTVGRLSQAQRTTFGFFDP